MKLTGGTIGQWKWGKEIENRESKEVLAGQVALYVKEGQVIGVGSGSTSYLTLLAIAERVRKEGLSIKVIPSSLELTYFCYKLGLPVCSLMEYTPDWCFDGADEVDPFQSLIKGRGGAMFREKLIIRSSPKAFILVDESKRVSRLGSRFPVPLEVFPMALSYVEKALQEYHPEQILLRMAAGKDGPVITENGNLILDIYFSDISPGMEKELATISGVIESGLFIGYKNIVIIDN